MKVTEVPEQIVSPGDVVIETAAAPAPEMVKVAALLVALGVQPLTTQRYLYAFWVFETVVRTKLAVVAPL